MRSHLKDLFALLGFGLLGSIVAPAYATAADTPLVPIISLFHHWDHHWYLWLPGDPVYEAVEVMAAERAPNTSPLVWVFFTERDGPKHQVHYLNDSRLAAATGAVSREIALTMAGAEGGPRGVSVKLVDVQGRPVSIDVELAADARLTTRGAGLTNQIGHSADRLLLVFFREKHAYAQTWHVMIAGTDVAEPQPGQNHPVPFPAAYSSNIFVGGFPYGDRRVSFEAARRGEGGEIERFAFAGTPGTYRADLSNGTSIELEAAADAKLRGYRHRQGEHELEITFDPPLQSARRLSGEIDSGYRISLDGFRDLLVGNVQTARRGETIVLDWHFETPDWTRNHPMRTTVQLGDASATRIDLQPLRPGP